MNQATPCFSPNLISDLLDIIYNAIIVVDADHHIIFANSRTAAMFKTTTDQLIGNKFHHLFSNDDTSILVPNILTITRNQKEFEGEALLMRHDNTSFLGLISGTFFHWADDREGMAFTIHDITPMRSLENTLKETERVAFLGRLIHDINHQIRNPVTVIGGFARRLENSQAIKTQYTKAIKDESEKLEKLLEVINNFIGQPAPSPFKIALDELAEMMEATFKPLVEEMGGSLESSYLDNSNERILVDPDLLLSALEAIIINGLEAYGHGHKNKEISLQMGRSGNPEYPFLISVTDKGCGIRADSMKRIFSHFYTEKTGNIGMGLTFARKNIEEQHGKIDVISEKGKGSIFTIYLVKERRREIRTQLIQ